MAIDSSLSKVSDETLRNFGYLAGMICFGLGLYQLTILPLGKHASFIETYALIILGFLFTGAGKLKPTVLVWPCRAWLTIGHIVGAIVSPVVVGILYYVIFSPIAMAYRLITNQQNPTQTTWKVSPSNGQSIENFKRQY